MGSESSVKSLAAARRSVLILSLGLGLLFLLGSMGAAMTLLSPSPTRTGDPSAGRTDKEGSSKSERTPPLSGKTSLSDVREFESRPPAPERWQLVLTLAGGIAGAVLGLGGFLLRRRGAGLYLQRGLGILLAANAAYLPFSLAAPLAGPSLGIIALAGLGLWLVLVTWHPAFRSA